MAATGWEAVGGRGREGEGGGGEGEWLAATGWEAVGGRGGGVVDSYWMGGSRREGEGRGSGWQLLDGRQEGGGGGGEGEGKFVLTHTSAWQSSSAVNLHNATTEGTPDTPPEGAGWQRVAS